LVGLALLVVGSQWLVEAAVTTATTLGVSELVNTWGLDGFEAFVRKQQVQEIHVLCTFMSL
jgi:hypothetical protein